MSDLILTNTVYFIANSGQNNEASLGEPTYLDLLYGHTFGRFNFWLRKDYIINELKLAKGRPQAE